MELLNFKDFRGIVLVILCCVGWFGRYCFCFWCFCFGIVVCSGWFGLLSILFLVYFFVGLDFCKSCVFLFIIVGFLVIGVYNFGFDLLVYGLILGMDFCIDGKMFVFCLVVWGGKLNFIFFCVGFGFCIVVIFFVVGNWRMDVFWGVFC